MPQRGPAYVHCRAIQPGDLIDARRLWDSDRGDLLRGCDEERGRFHPAGAHDRENAAREYLWDNPGWTGTPPGHKVLDQRRASIPTFHPLERRAAKSTQQTTEVPRQEAGAAQ